MTIFKSNPYDSDDINELRESIVILREMVISLQKIGNCNQKMHDMLIEQNGQQGDIIDIQKKLIAHYEARIAGYEAATSMILVNTPQRLN